jgi:hypothetical protein
MEMNEAGIQQACAAFFKNDLFYPRPGTEEVADERLWMVFKQKFLLSSQKILGATSHDRWSFADRLMEKIEEEGRSRRKAKERRVSQVHQQI